MEFVRVQSLVLSTLVFLQNGLPEPDNRKNRLSNSTQLWERNSQAVTDDTSSRQVWVLFSQKSLFEQNKQHFDFAFPNPLKPMLKSRSKYEWSRQFVRLFKLFNSQKWRNFLPKTNGTRLEVYRIDRPRSVLKYGLKSNSCCSKQMVSFQADWVLLNDILKTQAWIRRNPGQDQKELSHWQLSEQLSRFPWIRGLW